MKIFLFTVVGLGLTGAAFAAPFTQCPGGAVAAATGFAYTGCNVLITATAAGSTVQTDNTQPPGFGQSPYEDQVVGFQNNSGHSVSFITLTDASGSASPIFNFDYDGPVSGSYSCIPTFGVSGTFSTPFSGYEGPNNTFTNINTACTTGQVNFNTAIANGGSAYFYLEGAPTGLLSAAIPGGTTPTPPAGGATPEPASFTLMAAGLAGTAFLLRRHRAG